MQVQMVEIDPEPVDAMQSRFTRALEHVYDCRTITAGGISPVEVKANVFDWHDGLRLVVVRKRHHQRPQLTFLHVSAGIHRPTVRPADADDADDESRGRHRVVQGSGQAALPDDFGDRDSSTSSASTAPASSTS